MHLSAGFLPSGGWIRRGLHVNPVTISLEAKQRTSVLTVKNHAEEKLTLQVSAFAWSQDNDGNDVYEGTGDVIAFPKIFSMKKGEERIVRIGIKPPAEPREKTYRVYLEEVPPPPEAPLSGAVVRTLMKVGVPIFLAPVKPAPAGTIEQFTLLRNTLAFSLMNTGNIHFIVRGVGIRGLDTAGTAVFEKNLSGWYVLSGRTKTFTASIPPAVCAVIASITVEVSTDIISLRKSLNVLPEMCSP